jgi:hypothetical protein
VLYFTVANDIPACFNSCTFLNSEATTRWTTSQNADNIPQLSAVEQKAGVDHPPGTLVYGGREKKPRLCPQAGADNFEIYKPLLPLRIWSSGLAVGLLSNY